MLEAFRARRRFCRDGVKHQHPEALDRERMVEEPCAISEVETI